MEQLCNEQIFQIVVLAVDKKQTRKKKTNMDVVQTRLLSCLNCVLQMLDWTDLYKEKWVVKYEKLSLLWSHI